MKKVLLTLAAIAIASTPILAAAQSDHPERTKEERPERKETARPEGRPATGRSDEARGRMDETRGRVDETRGRVDETRGRVDEARGRADEARGRADAARGRHGTVERIDERTVNRTTINRTTINRTAVYNRSNPGWWRGRPEFAGYGGARPGFWFVPGFGYRGVPSAYWGYHWGIGVTVPGLFFGDSAYYVADPGIYGVDPAPYGYRWIYLGPNIALVNPYGRIVQLVPNVY